MIAAAAMALAVVAALAVSTMRRAAKLRAIGAEAKASLARVDAGVVAAAKRERDAAVDAQIRRLPMTPAATELVGILRRHGVAVALVEVHDGTPRVYVDGSVPRAADEEVARASTRWPCGSVTMVLGAWRLFR